MQDVEWWLREKIQEMNYSTWFMPDVEVVHPDSAIGRIAPVPSKPINYGDVLHVDFGVTALGMNTDTQHLAYVLYPGETEADVPRGLIEGLKTANRLQDIVKSSMKVGTTGNEILKKSLKQMKSEGIEGKIYSHPIGDWGHSAGTLVGKFLSSTYISCHSLTFKRYDQPTRWCSNSGGPSSIKQYILQC